MFLIAKSFGARSVDGCARPLRDVKEFYLARVTTALENATLCVLLDVDSITNIDWTLTYNNMHGEVLSTRTHG